LAGLTPEPIRKTAAPKPEMHKEQGDQKPSKFQNLLCFLTLTKIPLIATIQSHGSAALALLWMTSMRRTGCLYAYMPICRLPDSPRAEAEIHRILLRNLLLRLKPHFWPPSGKSKFSVASLISKK
jgi:hypothetical protein